MMSLDEDDLCLFFFSPKKGKCPYYKNVDVIVCLWLVIFFPNKNFTHDKHFVLLVQIGLEKTSEYPPHVPVTS